MMNTLLEPTKFITKVQFMWYDFPSCNVFTRASVLLFFFVWSPKWGSWSQAFLAQPSKTGV